MDDPKEMRFYNDHFYLLVILLIKITVNKITRSKISNFGIFSPISVFVISSVLIPNKSYVFDIISSIEYPSFMFKEY